MARARVHKYSKRSILAAGLGTTAIISALLYQSIFANTSYSVARVIDGDTFETVQKQRVRIADIQAPEPGLCGSDESKRALATLIEGKTVYFKVLYTDPYRRLIADVYTANGESVAMMLAQGGHVSIQQKNQSSAELLRAGNDARIAKKGIFGSKCTQETNVEHPSCVIKGNKNMGASIYHVPGCKSYRVAKVELYKGDMWFCTETEAKKAGFTKAESCK